MFEILRQDVHYASRRLLKSPGFTFVALLTLALGIGANSAIFSVVNAVLLQPLPYPNSDRLVGVFHVYQGKHTAMSGPNFLDAVRSATSLENAAAVQRSRVVLTGAGDAVRLDAAEVSASLFNVLRVHPEIGRTFASDEDTPGKTNVIVLSYALWQERFGGSRDVVGKRIQIDGVAKEVIGVAPKGFSYPAGREAWMPIAYDQDFVSKQRGAWQISGVARLKDGVTPAQSAAEVESIGRNLARQYADFNANVGMTTAPLHEAMVGDVRSSVLVLLGAVGFVLLIACTNVANLLLARATARESEMAVRAALGASRGRLLRQLLTECVLLSLAGGALGLLLAVWGVSFLIGLKPADIPRLDAISVDASVIAFTIGVSLLTGLIFGLVPAAHASRAALSSSLKEGGRGAVVSRGSARLRSALVVVEMALAVLLLVGAGLLMRSFVRLQSVDPGFSPNQTLSFELTLPDSRYENDAPRVALFDQLLPRLRALPGVQRVGAVTGLPLAGFQFDISFMVAGRPPVPPADQPDMEIRVATADYFGTIGIPLVRGRLFSDDDRPGSPPVVLITEAAARRFFPNEDPLGKTIKLGWGKRNSAGRVTAGGSVVGIVGDTKDAGLDEPNAPQLYLPFRQWPVSAMSVLLKTSTPPASLADAVRTQVAAIDPNLPVSNIRTLDDIVSKSISQPRFYMTLLAIFAGVALVLAAIGIFGVLSYAVSQRTREIGIRMALGARESSVIGLVVWRAMGLVAVGVAAGLVGAAVVSHTLTKMLFGVTPTDPVTFVSVSALLGLVALLASYWPARRAARVDPIVALRAE